MFTCSNSVSTLNLFVPGVSCADAAKLEQRPALEGTGVPTSVDVFCFVAEPYQAQPLNLKP